MDDHTHGPGHSHSHSQEETRYWRIRTILEAVKFTAWTAVFTLHTLTATGWTPHL